MTYRTVARFGLGCLAVSALSVGVWGTVAPRAFYDDFPGLGRMWISPDGPYNEHLLRDVAGLQLGLAVVLVASAVHLSREMVMTAAVASLAFGVPHLLYHAFNAEVLGPSDRVLNLTLLALGASLPVGLLWLAPRLEERER